MRWGETAQAKAARIMEYQERRQEWRRTFAWLPHRTLHGYIWLEWAERREQWYSGMGWECDGAGWYAEWRII